MCLGVRHHPNLGRGWVSDDSSFHQGMPLLSCCFFIHYSVADPDPGSGAVLTPGSGMGKKSRAGSGIRNLFYPGSGIWDGKFGSGIRNGKSDSGSGKNFPDTQHLQLPKFPIVVLPWYFFSKKFCVMGEGYLGNIGPRWVADNMLHPFWGFSW
jgi:hypothetical protein